EYLRQLLEVSMLAFLLVDDACRGLPLRGTQLDAEVPTYHRDIAPLFASHCTGCHHAGGIAPFPLDSYKGARTHSLAIALSTKTRRMPPSNLDNSGECNTFIDAPWLTDEEIATIGAWVQGGAPEGDPLDDPPELPPPAPHRVDLTVAME